MRHIIDEVVLNLGIALLAEDDDDGKDEGDEQYHGEDHGGNHEADARIDIRVHIGEMDAHHAGLCRWVVAEQCLRIAPLLALGRVVGTAIYLASVRGKHHQVVRHVDAVALQLHANLLIQEFEVHTFLQGLLAGGIENVIHHLVEQCFLIDIAGADSLL